MTATKKQTKKTAKKGSTQALFSTSDRPRTEKESQRLRSIRARQKPEPVDLTAMPGLRNYLIGELGRLRGEHPDNALYESFEPEQLLNDYGGPQLVAYRAVESLFLLRKLRSKPDIVRYTMIFGDCDANVENLAKDYGLTKNELIAICKSRSSRTSERIRGTALRKLHDELQKARR